MKCYTLSPCLSMNVKVNVSANIISCSFQLTSSTGFISVFIYNQLQQRSDIQHVLYYITKEAKDVSEIDRKSDRCDEEAGIVITASRYKLQLISTGVSQHFLPELYHPMYSPRFFSTFTDLSQHPMLHLLLIINTCFHSAQQSVIF